MGIFNRAEIQAAKTDEYNASIEGEDHRTNPGTTKLTTAKEFETTKTAWTQMGIVTYCVVALGEGRINTRINEMGKLNIK